MKKPFVISLLILWILFPTLLGAQAPQKKVTNASDLPRFSYDAPDSLSDLFTSATIYKSFATKIRTDRVHFTFSFRQLHG